MPNTVILDYEARVNGSACTKVIVDEITGEGVVPQIELDLMLEHGKYTTIRMTNEDFLKIARFAMKSAGGTFDAGHSFMVGEQG